MQIAEWNLFLLINSDLGKHSLLMCVDSTTFTSRKWEMLQVSMGSSPGCCRQPQAVWLRCVSSQEGCTGHASSLHRRKMS